MATVTLYQRLNTAGYPLTPVPYSRNKMPMADANATSFYLRYSLGGKRKCDPAGKDVVEAETVTADQGGTWTVDIAASQTIAVTNAGTFAVQDATAEGYLDTLAGTVSAGKVAVEASIAASQTIAVTNAGTFAVQASIDASQTIAVTQATAADLNATVTLAANNTASGGSLTNAAVSVKASAGTVSGYYLDNTTNTATTYFQFFDAASVTVGTTAPLFSIGVPGGGAANLTNIGAAFATAIQIAATAGYSNGSAPSNDVTYTVWYS